MSDIFDEKNMMASLGRYLPEGETITAGVHGVGLETKVIWVFSSCLLHEDMIIPHPDGITVEAVKGKYAKHDVYIGITQNYLILSECYENKHYYEFNDVSGQERTDVTELDRPISIKDIDINRFPLAEIQSCTVKKGMMGSVICSVTMRNGSFLKLMLPKLGGLGGGMPHHKEYREAILSRLSSCGG